MNAQAWWPLLTQVVPQQIIFVPHRQVKPETRFYADLARRLSFALQSSNECNRPTKKAVFLKNALLCSQYTLKAFNHKRWKTWRNDDAGGGDTPAP